MCPAPASTTPPWSRRSTRPATTRCRHERSGQAASASRRSWRSCSASPTVAGGAVGPDRADDAAKRADTPAGHGDDEPRGRRHGERVGDAGGHDADAVRGLAVADDGLRLSLASTSLPRGRATTLRFTIDGADGPVRDFEVEHEKRMHLIVVRRDGSGFQHLHPTLAPDGTWSTQVTLPDAGAYRVFADFKRGENETLAADLTVDGDADYRALPERTDVDTTDGYTRRASTSTTASSASTITRDGKPVETEPYLGAGGHLVALREGDLAYLHVHPVDGGGVEFETELDPDSRYRLYLQFKHEGQVHTAEFTR